MAEKHPLLSRRATLRAEHFAEAFGLVFILTLITFLALSWLPSTPWARAAGVSLAGLTAITGLISSGVRRTRIHQATAIVVVSAVLAGIAAAADSRWTAVVSIALVMVIVVIAQGAIMRRVLTAAQVNLRTILGALTTYALFGIVYGYLFAITNLVQDKPFFSTGATTQTGDMVFFSYTTLTTTGYGNLVPASEPGQSFAVLEMLTGQIFLVTLVAGLVSLWRPASRGQRGGSGEPAAEDSRS